MTNILYVALASSNPQPYLASKVRADNILQTSLRLMSE